MPNDIQSTGNATIDEFLREKLAETQSSPSRRGRLIFALDATASRQPTWDQASHLQAEMFKEVSARGGLDVQLVYYRGEGECQASGWVGDTAKLTKLMTKIECRSGITQLAKVLAHTQRENQRDKVHALVFVGDALEENPHELYEAAYGLGGVPLFMFQEGEDPGTMVAFVHLTGITKGAYAHFNSGAAKRLGELLRAVAVFATGGLAALTHRKDPASVELLEQLR